MNTIRFTRLAIVAAVVVALAALPAISGAKSSSKSLTFKKTGGTTLKLDSGTAEALTSLGVSVAPIKPAKAGSKGVTFPITGGKVNAKSLAGNIKHSGGLRLSSGSTNVDLTDFTIKIGKKPNLVASVGDARVSILTLDLSKLKNSSKGKKIKLSGVKASLTQAAADALNGAFGTTAFTKGLVLGTATVEGRVK